MFTLNFHIYILFLLILPTVMFCVYGQSSTHLNGLFLSAGKAEYGSSDTVFTTAVHLRCCNVGLKMLLRKRQRDSLIISQQIWSLLLIIRMDIFISILHFAHMFHSLVQLLSGLIKTIRIN